MVSKVQKDGGMYAAIPLMHWCTKKRYIQVIYKPVLYRWLHLAKFHNKQMTSLMSSRFTILRRIISYYYLYRSCNLVQPSLMKDSHSFFACVKITLIKIIFQPNFHCQHVLVEVHTVARSVLFSWCVAIVIKES